MSDTNPAIAAAAQRVAQAEVAAQEGTAAHRAVETEVATMRSRLAEFDAKRKEIGARRAQGDQRANDGETLALLAADAEALVEILARREADVAAARAQAEMAVRALQQARAELRRAEDQAVERQLVDRAEELGSMLAGAIEELRSVRSRLGGGRLGWVPSRKLASEISILDNGRPW